MAAVEAGADWCCTTCGQRWDAVRLATVASYALWAAEHDRSERGRREAAAQPTTRIDHDVPLTSPSEHGDAIARWDADGGQPPAK
jgi:hypothetical protein